MTYHIARTLEGTGIEEAEERVIKALKDEGFGVLTRIDVREVLNEKIGVNFRPYRILGACNPQLAHQALQVEDKIGTLLPCNVILQERGKDIEIAAIDPAESMKMVENDALQDIAGDVRDRLKRVIDAA